MGVSLSCYRPEFVLSEPDYWLETIVRLPDVVCSFESVLADFVVSDSWSTLL